MDGVGFLMSDVKLDIRRFLGKGVRTSKVW